jgi:pilus assembly protein CpaB
MKTTRVLIVLVLAIIFGLASGYSALQYLNRRPATVTESSEGETVPVVLAAQDLPLGKVLEEADLRIVGWPASAVPIGVAASKEELIGRSLISNVLANEAVLAAKLADTGLRGIIPLIPFGMRAMSISVDQVVGVAGFVTPQTTVDVILVMQPPGSQDMVSQVILENVQTLAAGEEIQETEDGEPVTVPVVTLLVSPAEAEKLALAANEGVIRLALRHTLDVESVETDGQRASSLFAGGRFLRSRPAARVGTSPPTAQESIIEIYRGGVRTLVYY